MIKNKEEAIGLIRSAVYYCDNTTDGGETLDFVLEHLGETRDSLEEAFAFLDGDNNG